MESFLDRLLADTEAAIQPEKPAAGAAALVPDASPIPAPAPHGLPDVPSGGGAPRIAIYDALTSPPRVVVVEEKDLPALIASLAEKTYSHCREQGGQIPYTVLQELIENLLHAYFKDVVITILDNGQTIRISDHGPGVDDKERAFLPGFTTATAMQRDLIRGVGSGLPVARESLQFLRGVLTVEDNLGGGAVFTIKMPAHAAGRHAFRGEALDPSDQGPGSAHGVGRRGPYRRRQGTRRRPGNRVSRTRYTAGDGPDPRGRRR
jgi:signal transduction histidine kinase